MVVERKAWVSWRINANLKVDRLLRAKSNCILLTNTDMKDRTIRTLRFQATNTKGEMISHGGSIEQSGIKAHSSDPEVLSQRNYSIRCDKEIGASSTASRSVTPN